MIYEVMAGSLMAIVVLKRAKPEISIKQKGSMLAFINGIIGYIGVLLYIYAISKQDAILVAPLSATFPIITLLLGIMFLKEKFSTVNYLGVFLALVAIYLVFS